LHLGNFQLRAQSYASQIANVGGSDPAIDGAEYNLSADDIGAGPNLSDYPAAYINIMNTEQRQLYMRKIDLLNNNPNIKMDEKLDYDGFVISASSDLKKKENSYLVNPDGTIRERDKGRCS